MKSQKSGGDNKLWRDSMVWFMIIVFLQKNKFDINNKKIDEIINEHDGKKKNYF